MSRARERQQAKLEIVRALIPASEKWNPLEGGDASDYVPDEWVGYHVGRRLMECFQTLQMLPMRSVGGYGAAWPEYEREFADVIGQGEDARAIEASARNRARLMPSREQITRMEIAIIWPARYVPDERVRKTVQRVAMLRSRELNLEQISRRLKRPAKGIRNENRKGLDQIAAGLRRDAIAVF